MPKNNVKEQYSGHITNPLLSCRVPDQELVQLILVLHRLGHEGCSGENKQLHDKLLHIVKMLM